MAELTLREIALHEAAHAVVAAAIGIQVESVTIAPTDDYRGRARFVPDDSWGPMALHGAAGERWMRGHLYSTLAGPLAEVFASGQGVDWDTTDSDPGTDLHAIIDYLLSDLAPGEDAGPAIRRTERGARLLLRRHWPRVQRLANALLAEQTLSGERLAAELEGLGAIGARHRFAEWDRLPAWALVTPADLEDAKKRVRELSRPGDGGLDDPAALLDAKLIV